MQATDAFSLPNLCRYFSERSPQPMVAVEGRTYVIRHANAAFLALAGASLSELMDRPFAQAVPEGKANGCIALLDRVYLSGTPESLLEQKHGDLHPIYWSYYVWAILGSDDRPVGVMVQVTDATETATFRAKSAAMNEALLLAAIRQHELSEKAEQAQVKYRSLFNSIDEGFCVIEKVVVNAGEPLDFRYVEANPAFETQSGVGGVVGKTIRQAFPGVSEEWFATYDAVLRTGQPIRFERPLVTQDRALELYAFRVESDTQQRVAVIFRDVTARKQTEQALAQTHVELHSHTEAVTRLNEKLQAAMREKEYFIAVLSHELRTPLAPVLIATSMLQQDGRLEPEVHETMEMIHRNITLESRLIDDLLDMTRMERGKVALTCCAIDLRQVLEVAVEASKADLEAGNLELEFDTGARPQIVSADAGRLQQVFSNLLRNAIKFTPSGGQIRIRSRCAEDFCTVEVRDNGIGMDREFIPRAFSAFEQGSKTDAAQSGLGLGLAICKSIVELHGGTITAHSAGRNRGSTFSVQLPAVKGLASIPVARKPDAPDTLPPAKHLRILLVEDHADTARAMRRLLAAEGHTVQWAGDISTAVALAQDHEFDLLLSDLGLPDGTGVDLMGILRQKGSALPGIILSGYGQIEDISRSREAGFAAHLVKPLSAQTLRDAIVKVVGA